LKNAFFNIERLGAIVKRYVPNQYGRTSSHLHGGLPTDRLVPEWWIESTRVKQLVQTGSFEGGAVEARISVVNNIAELRRSEPERAREIQADIASQFDQCFRADLAVIGFERSQKAGTYLLGPWQLQ
jgi:predicted GNAT superfamily acetyltransferase